MNLPSEFVLVEIKYGRRMKKSVALKKNNRKTLNGVLDPDFSKD